MDFFQVAANTIRKKLTMYFNRQVNFLEDFQKVLIKIWISDEENTAEEELNDNIPSKSRERYEWSYNQYLTWCECHNADLLSENDIVAYFQYLSEMFKSSTLWKTYSMLRATIHYKHNLNIANYSSLKTLLKEKSQGYQAKKCKVLSVHEIVKFVREAPDNIHLGTKVVLIMGLIGACGKQELYQMKIDDVKDLGEAILVHVTGNQSNVPRNFAITGEYYPYVKKYLELRPPFVERNNLFLNYQKGKCTQQVVGINKLGSVSKRVASFLKLREPEKYSGYGFRRISASLLKRIGSEPPQEENVER